MHFEARGFSPVLSLLKSCPALVGAGLSVFVSLQQFPLGCGIVGASSKRSSHGVSATTKAGSAEGKEAMTTKDGGEEIGQRGQEIYDRLRTLLETEENIGRIVSIDVESGDYEIGEDLVAAGRRLQQRRPDARMYGKRIGYNAVYAVGGSLTRTAR